MVFAALILRLFVLLCLSSLLISNAVGSDRVVREPAPDWISETDIIGSAPDNMGTTPGGLDSLLFSRQVYFDGETRQEFYRSATKITSRAGLENGGALSFDFRPGLEEIRLHSLRVYRDNEIIDLTQTAEFSLLRRETELERGILDGRMTAFTNLPDVRVNDIVEFAYSRTYRTVLMGNHFFDTFTMSFSVPVGMLEYRLTVPEQLALQIRANRSGISPATIEESDGFRKYSWTIRNTPVYNAEEHAPTWHIPYDYIEISSIKKWDDISIDLSEFYPDALELPSPLKARVDEILNDATDGRQRVIKALAMVQNDIRYVGIEIGRGAFIARHPRTVVERGYGDCKDKSYLLVAVLRALGIDAVPVLANLRTGRMLNNALPSPWAFDHMIVQISVDGQNYWLEPTNTHERGPALQNLTPDYGYVLPVLEGGSSLVEIRSVVSEEPTTHIIEEVALDFSGNGPLFVLDVTTNYSGSDANQFRRYVDLHGIDQISESYLRYFEKLHPGSKACRRVEI